MADTFTLIPQDEEGERIIGQFAAQTGLEAEEDGDRHVFEIDGEEHEIPFVQTLDEIDEDWNEHVVIEPPT